MAAKPKRIATAQHNCWKLDARRHKTMSGLEHEQLDFPSTYLLAASNPVLPQQQLNPKTELQSTAAVHLEEALQAGGEVLLVYEVLRQHQQERVERIGHLLDNEE